ncbi:Cupredoxin [Mycena vulgaris]|nr:Cupredoxin [Mycena vulgaris]
MSLGQHISIAKRDPTTISTTKQPLVETALHLLVPTPVPGGRCHGCVDYPLTLDISLNFTTFKWQPDGTTFESPKVPVLLQILSGVVEISIPGGAPGAPHPFHLHRHAVHVVCSAGNDTYNYGNPVVRDVVSAGNNTDDLAVFRFKTDNAGPWLLHCHIDLHLDADLAVVFAENIPAMAHENPPSRPSYIFPSVLADAMAAVD